MIFIFITTVYYKFSLCSDIIAKGILAFTNGQNKLLDIDIIWSYINSKMVWELNYNKRIFGI